MSVKADRYTSVCVLENSAEFLVEETLAYPQKRCGLDLPPMPGVCRCQLHRLCLMCYCPAASIFTHTEGPP